MLVAQPTWSAHSALAKASMFNSKDRSRSNWKKDGIGHIVAQVGPQIGPNAFSSLASTREWLTTDVAKAFARAYRRTRVYMNEISADEIARAEKSFSPDIDEDVLTACIATYQSLGCWTPHIEITRPAFEVTLDVFEYNGTLKERYGYDQVCVAPPAG